MSVKTTTCVNGTLKAGDLVVSIPSADEYSYLVGRVIYIVPLGSPGRETCNETDDVHVNFIFDYSPDRFSEIWALFNNLYGEEKMQDECPLEDVIMAPDCLIRITGIDEDRLSQLLESERNVARYCCEVLSDLLRQAKTDGNVSNSAHMRTPFPVFDPDNFEVRDKIYDNTGGHCMVGTIKFYLPGADKFVWVNCSNESVGIYSADVTWNEDDSGSCENSEDYLLFQESFGDNVPSAAEPWLPMIMETLAYTIENETAYFKRAFSLPVAWLPETIRANAKPEYLDWLLQRNENAHITANLRILIDDTYTD